MPTEAERAATHQAQLAARCAARRERIAGLAGSTVARQVLADNWEAVYLAQLERGQVDPSPEELCLTPEEAELLGN